jgi:hypothetical protein
LEITIKRPNFALFWQGNWNTNFSMLPIIVTLQHIIHVGQDHSLHPPGAAEAAPDQRAACSLAACAWVAVRSPMQRSGCREPSVDVQCARDMQC